jgi:hypothetical protein
MSLQILKLVGKGEGYHCYKYKLFFFQFLFPEEVTHPFLSAEAFSFICMYFVLLMLKDCEICF